MGTPAVSPERRQRAWTQGVRCGGLAQGEEEERRDGTSSETGEIVNIVQCPRAIYCPNGCVIFLWRCLGEDGVIVGIWAPPGLGLCQERVVMGGKGAGGVGLAGNLVQSDTSIMGGPGGSGSLSGLSSPDLGGDARDAPHHVTPTPVPRQG